MAHLHLPVSEYTRRSNFAAAAAAIATAATTATADDNIDNS